MANIVPSVSDLVSPPVQGNPKLQELLKVHSMGEPAFPVSRHSFPDYSSIALPVALPVEKDRVRLQVRMLNTTS